MLALRMDRLALAIGENFAKKVGLTSIVKRVIKRSDCGGVRWTERPLQETVSRMGSICFRIREQLGDVGGLVGAEIGPGDNLGATYFMLKNGARKMYAIEKHASVSPELCAKLFSQVDAESDALPRATDVYRAGHFNPAILQHSRETFEDFVPDEPLDFIYSHDVIEHVNPATLFKRAFEVLKPGGSFVNMIDLTGHGVFYDLNRPLDFLTCPDWLWPILFSEMETTNRVRWSELLTLSKDLGFEIVTAKPIRRASPEYMASIRPHLLPRYQRLTDDDLSVMQCTLHLRKPI